MCCLSFRYNFLFGITKILKLLCEASDIIKMNEYADKTDKEYCGEGV